MRPSTCGRKRSCGWTADFEQLQLISQRPPVGQVAAGLRILNSYNAHCTGPCISVVAAGLRILNSYNKQDNQQNGEQVAAGLRILNSYNI